MVGTTEGTVIVDTGRVTVDPTTVTVEVAVTSSVKTAVMSFTVVAMTSPVAV